MRIDDAVKAWGDYQGSLRKPSDFDLFWQEAKEEVHQLGGNYQLKKLAFSSQVAEAYELTFEGVGKATIYCQCLIPKEKKRTSSPVMIQFHGYHGHSGDWSDKVGLVAEGFIVVAMDVRGQGGLSQDSQQVNGGTLKGHLIRGVEEGPKRLFFRSVFQDIYQLCCLLGTMKFVDVTHMMSCGASQGGGLALVCASLFPQITKVFVQYPFLSDYREAYALNVTQSAYEELAYYFRYRDPLHQKEEQVFSALDYIDIQYFVPSIQANVLWAMALEDPICHPKTQFASYNQIRSKKRLLFYPEYGHEYLPKFGDIMREELFK